VVRAQVASKNVDRWFFIRYSDPDWHLRLRCFGPSDNLWAQAQPELSRALDGLLRDGLIHRVQYDTYEREVERYGGEVALPIAEQIFQVDSEAVLEMLAHLGGDDDLRWRLALLGIHHLLEGVGLTLEERLAFAQESRTSLGREQSAGAALWHAIGRKFRPLRRELEALVGSDPPLAPALAQALRRRQDRLLPLVERLRSALSRPQLSSVAWSLCHMHANRLLVTQGRQQEMVIYELLARLYEGQLARAVQSGGGAAGGRRSTVAATRPRT
jgi:thiopeptide-type bacteriocin biosynthesis protein